MEGLILTLSIIIVEGRISWSIPRDRINYERMSVLHQNMEGTGKSPPPSRFSHNGGLSSFSAEVKIVIYLNSRIKIRFSQDFPRKIPRKVPIPPSFWWSSPKKTPCLFGENLFHIPSQPPAMPQVDLPFRPTLQNLGYRNISIWNQLNLMWLFLDWNLHTLHSWK